MGERCNTTVDNKHFNPPVHEADMASKVTKDALFAFDEQIQMRMHEEGHAGWYEPMDREAWEAMVAGSRIFVINHPEDGIVGYACTKPLSEEEAVSYYRDQIEVQSTRILDIATIAAYPAGRGYGRQLLERVEQEAQTEGYSDLRLYVSALNTTARRLYERAGFCCSFFKDAKRYYVGGEEEDDFKFFYFKPIIFIPESERQRELRLRNDSTRRLNRRLAEYCMKLSTDLFVPGRSNKVFEPLEVWTARVDACTKHYLQEVGLPPDTPLPELNEPHKLAIATRLKKHGLKDDIYAFELSKGSFNTTSVYYFANLLGISIEEMIRLGDKAREILKCEE